MSGSLVWTPVLLALLSGGNTVGREAPVGVQRQVARSPVATGTIYGRVGQTILGGNLGQDNTTFTDLRLTASVGLDAAGGLGLESDVRARVGNQGASFRRYDVSRLYLRYGKEASWAVDIGRIPLTALAGAQVDGTRFTLGVDEGVSLSVFGGLVPHPIERSVSFDFVGFGAGYQVRGKAVNHAGGVMGQLYQGEVDRLFVVERFFFRLSDQWTAFGLATVDLVGGSGVLGELAGKSTDEQSGLDRIDLTHGFLQVRFRPVPAFDISVIGSHVHTLLPRLWWQDWVEGERARLGFTIDGAEPVGTRRTSARAVANFHFGSIGPYVSGRYDMRHEDGSTGFAGRMGLKLNPLSFGYVDLFGEHRRQFEAEQQVAGLRVGLTVIDGLSFDVGGSGLRNRAFEGDGDVRWLAEGNASLAWSLGVLEPSLAGIALVTFYQLFVESDVVQHFGFLQLGYRLSL